MTSSSEQQQDSDQFGFGHDSGGTRSSKRSSSYNESPFFLSLFRILRRNMANIFLPEGREQHHPVNDCTAKVGTTQLGFV